MKMHIKRFEELTGAEVYEILRSRQDVFIIEQECRYEDIDGADSHATHIYFEENGRIRAYLRVIDPGVKFEAASIGRVLTSKDARGKGLARILMQEGIRIAREKSPVIEIEAQTYLRDFYKSLGFRETSAEFLDAGIPHVNMKLE